MEILSCESIQVWRTAAIVITIVFSSVAALSGLVWLWVSLYDCFFTYKVQEIIQSISGFIFVVMLIALIVTVVVGDSTKIDSGRYKYKVTLSQDYDLKELAEEYEIKERCGKIWVIKDKKPKEVKDEKE